MALGLLDWLSDCSQTEIIDWKPRFSANCLHFPDLSSIFDTVVIVFSSKNSSAYKKWLIVQYRIGNLQKKQSIYLQFDWVIFFYILFDDFRNLKSINVHLYFWNIYIYWKKLFKFTWGFLLLAAIDNMKLLSYFITGSAWKNHEN